MRRYSAAALFFLWLAIPSGLYSADLSVYFSPKGGITQAIVAEINAAKGEVLVQAYTFTSAPVSRALIAAMKRGVQVSVLFDKKAVATGYAPQQKILAAAGVHCFVDGAHPIAHSKIIVIDGKEVITGSFNYSNRAELFNAENIVIIRNDQWTVDAYRQNWQAHKAHSSAGGQ